jgi:hypothetical protein
MNRKDVIDLAQAAAVLLLESGKPFSVATASDAMAAVLVLSGLAKTLKAVAEADCNGFRDDLEREVAEKTAARALKKAARTLEPWGVDFLTEGDPRGSQLRLKTPKTGAANTWGGAESGWAL